MMPDPSVDLAVRGGTVVPLDRPEPVRADVYIDRGRVVAVGGERREARRVVDAHGLLVVPGLHNLHDHLRELTPGAAAGEGLKLDDMLRFFWRLGELAGTEEYRVMAALSSARLLRAGVTSVVDHLYPLHRPGLLEATIEGFRQTGIRWFVGRGLMTKGHDPICEPEARILDRVRAEADTVVPRERLFVAPVSFRQAEPALYARARALADELGVRLYTHVAETAAEVEMTQAAYGMRPVELLHSLGFTGPDTTLVHCVLLADNEIQMLADTGTHVVHCPTNHMKLAKGFTPVPRLLQAGVNVCLGVDVQVDLFREMRQEVLLQSIHNGDPSAILPRTALEMATVHGAAALGLGDELGTLSPGQRADLVCVDLSGLHAQPVLDPVWTLVYRCQGSDVVHVAVDGEVVVEDRRLTKVDERALLDEAIEIVGRFLRQADLDHRWLNAFSR